MNPMRRPHSDSVTVVLAILCGITAVAVWLFELPESDRDKVGRRNHAAHATGNIQTQISQSRQLTDTLIDNYSEILDRPIFSPSRQPIVEIEFDSPEPVRTTPSTQLADGEFRLVGIVIIDDNRFALLQTTGTPGTQRALVGDTVDGWRITSLTPDTATMERGAQSKSIKLERKSNPKLVARTLARKRREQLAAAKTIQQKIVANAAAANSALKDSENESEDTGENDDE